MTDLVRQYPEATIGVLVSLSSFVSTLVLVFGTIAYRHIMKAFATSQLRDDALAKRITHYEEANNARYEKLIERLAHVEALVNGKNRRQRRA